ncbi:MAG: hypothetical protein HYU66_29415 [Armatimonadetes bacterium]|nr:hypothetical protein [Armatimonadota bacterium]
MQRIADEVKALPEHERDEFLSWLAEFELRQADAWDEQIAKDALPGGRLATMLQRARDDIAQGRTKPLDEVLRGR